MASQLRLALAVCLLCCLSSEGGFVGLAIAPQIEKPRDSSSALSEIRRKAKEFEDKMMNSVLLQVQFRSKLNPPSRARSWLQGGHPATSCVHCLDTNPLSPFGLCAQRSFADLLYPLLNEPAPKGLAAVPELSSSDNEQDVSEHKEQVLLVGEQEAVEMTVPHPANVTDTFHSDTPVTTPEAPIHSIAQDEDLTLPVSSGESNLADSPPSLEDQPVALPPPPQQPPLLAAVDFDAPMLEEVKIPSSYFRPNSVVFVLGALTASLLWWAISLLYRWIRVYPDKLMTWVHARAQQLSSRGQHDRLAADLRGILPRIRYFRGIAHRDTCACKHYLARALYHSKRMEDLTVAVKLLEEVRRAYVPFGDDRHMALVCEDLGRAHASLGDRLAALHCFKTALGIFTEEHLAQKYGREAGKKDIALSQSVLDSDTAHSSSSSSPSIALAADDDDDDWLQGPISTFPSNDAPDQLQGGQSEGQRQAVDNTPPSQRLEIAMEELDDLLQSSISSDTWRLTRQTPLHRQPLHEVVDRDVARVCMEIGEVFILEKDWSEAEVYLRRCQYIAEVLCGEQSLEAESVRQVMKKIPSLADGASNEAVKKKKCLLNESQQLSPSTVALFGIEKKEGGEVADQMAFLPFPSVGRP